MRKQRVFIIAEAGVNHNGSLEVAKRMIETASGAGADAVKFQTFTASSMIGRHASKAEYQQQTTGTEESQLEMMKKLELSPEAYKELQAHCHQQAIRFLSTPFDLDSIRLLSDLGLDTFKIPSGEITNLPYLRAIGQLRKQVILSTGMADLGEIEDALDVLVSEGTLKEQIAVLHCNTEYPTPMHDVNLRAMLTIKEAFNVDVGYSDHTPGLEIPIAAVALGASVIEKHFTLDRTLPGPDQKASLEPHELQSMVQAIRHVEQALGDGIKKASPSEQKNLPIARKSIVARQKILKGDVFTAHTLTSKRPGTGISPMEWDRVIGRKALRDFAEDEIVQI
ncbi:MAG: N-acetylneuraminate synthase [bacterium]|nr:N-acetylneuraminate synthase [bacterium]